MKSNQRLLDPTVVTGGNAGSLAAPTAPSAKAKVANTNSFIQVVDADGKELFIEVEDKFKQVINPFVQYTANEIVKAATVVKADAAKFVPAEVTKVAAWETKNPYTTAIIAGTAAIAGILLTIVAIHW